MSDCVPKVSRHEAGRRAARRASHPRARKALARAGQELAPEASSPDAAAPGGRAAGEPTMIQDDELRRVVATLRDEVRALGQRLAEREAAARQVAPGARAALAEIPQANAVQGPLAAGAPGSFGSPKSGSAQAHPLRCQIRELAVLAPDGSGSTRVLPARVPFEMRLAVDVSDDGTAVACPVECQVSVRAHRLDSQAGRSILLGETCETLSSVADLSSLRCKSQPLAAGLYRLEAAAAVRGPGDARASGLAFLSGSLVRAY
jgi:hypothetical protein